MQQIFKQVVPLALIAFPLASCVHSGEPHEFSISPPKSAAFGSTVESMTPIFESNCDTYEVRELDPADIPIAKTSHVQVNCHGLYHAGGKRLAEFVFADDRLAFIWVLTTAQEEPALLKALLKTYGEPKHDTPLFVAFTDDFLALRRDMPELLYYDQELAPVYEAWFDGSAGQQH